MLSTPASRPDRFASSHKSGADISMVDLEDSIAPSGKVEARRLAAGFFATPTAALTRCAIRINAVTEPDGLRDLLAVRDYEAKPQVIVIPKVESPRDVEIVEDVLAPRCPDIELFAVVETPRGLDRVAAIADATTRLRALVFGSADYSFAVGARLSWETLLPARARVVNSARAAEVEVIDSPSFELTDDARLDEDARLGRAFGFSGKVAVHPNQIPVINQAFSPDSEMIERANKILTAAEKSGDGISVVDGSMIGAPFFEAARRLIEQFG